MRKNIKRILIIIVAFLSILCVSYLYVFDPFIEQVRDTPTGLSDFRDRGGYKINPETIFASLEHGEKDVFTPEIVTPEAPVFEEPISWHQLDYQKIAGALHEFLWKETLDGWSLYYMDFSTVCHDGPSGFGLGDFYYFKTIFDKGQIGYTARELFISPQYGNVEWGGGINFPHPLLGWKSVNLDKVKTTAEDALRIAEENGGQAARLSVQNQCKIDVGLSGYAGWEVFIYEHDTGSSIFSVEIDPYTGKIE